ncbi:MAG: hypothetical protein JST82_10265 [Bacteroidetes bacterium]|nr:hypothetical protein [Bacteroidota bacterium]
MKYLLYIILLLSLANNAFAQHMPRPASPEVLAALDSASRRQKEDSYLSYLEKAAQLATDIEDYYGNALANQRIGSYYFSRDAHKAIAYQKKASEYFFKAEDAKMVAICMHNIGFIYDEQLHNTDSAIEAIDAAIYLHKKLRDTLEFANMCKYKGALVARKGDFTEAKRLINKAILYFGYKDYKQGIAVSWYDMAFVYVDAMQMDSALYYAKQAKAFWKTNNTPSRVFGINNSLVEWHMKLHKSPHGDNTIPDLLQENEDILKTENIYWKDRSQHYKNAARYAHQTKAPRETWYREANQHLMDSLKAKGIKTE